jgi:hypothetical protein
MLSALEQGQQLELLPVDFASSPEAELSQERQWFPVAHRPDVPWVRILPYHRANRRRSGRYRCGSIQWIRDHARHLRAMGQRLCRFNAVDVS